MTSNFCINLYFIFLISLGYVATDIYLPSLPALAKYFHATDNEVQKTLFFFLISFSFSPLIFGPISDHIGRKKVIFSGILIGMIATLGCLLSQNIQWFIGFRFLQGIGMGAVLIASRAAASDLFAGKALAKQLTFITMLLPIILSIAPTIGGILQETFQWQAVFVFLLCYLFFILIWVSFSSESLKNLSHEKISQVFFKYRSHLKNPLFIVFGTSYVLPSLGIFSYLTASPFLFQEIIGLSAMEYGALAIYIGAAIIISSYINLKLIHHFLVTSVLFFGAFLITLAGAILLSFHFTGQLTTWRLLFPVLIFFTCMPFCVSNAAAKSLSFIRSNFGAASAIMTTFQFLVGAIGSFIFSTIPDETALSLAVCFISVGCLTLVTLAYAVYLEKKLTHSSI